MRRPLKAALANRRMFRNGGMASPRSLGILSSSPNLIEAVSRDALNPQGGPTLGMNQGGIARMQKGGSPMPPPNYGISPSVSMDIMRYRGNPQTSNIKVPSLSLTEQLTRGKTSINDLLNQSARDRARRIFDPALASGMEDAPTTEPRSRVGSFLEQGGRLAGEIGQDISAGAGATYDWLFGSDSPPFNPGQRRAIAEMTQRRPDLAEDIATFSETAIKQNGDIETRELMERVATDLHNKYERTPELMSAVEEVRFQPGERLLQSSTGDVTGTPLVPTSPQGGTRDDPEAAMQAHLQQDMANYKNAQDPQAFIKELQELPDGPRRASLVLSSIQEFGGAKEEFPPYDPDAYYTDLETGKVTGPDVKGLYEATLTEGAGQGPPMLSPDRFKSVAELREFMRQADSAQERMAGEPPPVEEGVTVDQAEANEASIAAAALEEPADAAEKAAGEKAVAEGVAPPDTYKKLILDAANTGDDKAVTKNLDFFIDRFKKAIPEYEGKSEFEKGVDLIKMAMAIGAGQSPNAIENISKGVLATIDNFTSDAKAKRAYKQQVALSAGKYALQAVEREEVKADALLKEGRAIPYKLIALKDFTNKEGKEIKKGQVYPATRKQIDAGVLSDYPLTFESIYTANAKAIADVQIALAKATKEASDAKIIDYKEAKTIDDGLNTARENFIHATGGRAVMQDVIKLIAAEPRNVTGITAEAKNLWGKVLNAMGVEDKPLEYRTRDELITNLRIGFQEMIPVALRNIQAGNSISDRDVGNLADAFIMGGVIRRDTSGNYIINKEFAFGNPKQLVKQLQYSIGIFDNAQKEALTVFDQKLNAIGQAGAGRYGPEYFKPRIMAMGPALERYRESRQGKTLSPAAINVFEYFDRTGKQIKPLPRKQ